VVDPGVTLAVLPLIAPGFQVYVAPPLAVSVELLPAHITEGLAVTVSVGPLFTVTETTALLVQVPEEPITVYVVVIVGETVTLVPTRLPGFHVYVVAPAPVRVNELPAQIDVVELEALTVGIGTTVNPMVAELVQAPLLPTIV
jgi:hypothetical protein